MNASRTEATRRYARALTCALVALALFGLAGCHTAVPTDGVALFEREPITEPRAPTEVDRAVADLLTASLAGTAPQRERALERIKTLHDARAMKEARLYGQPEMRGLVPLSMDLVNSTLDDPQEYRRASKQILRSFSLDPDPALKARLEQSVADDPLALAHKRTIDYWEGLWAKTFNAIAEPIGRSLIWGVAIAPFNMATSVANYLMAIAAEPEVTLQERQALAHRKSFVAQYPTSVDTPKIEKKIASTQEELDEMQSENLEDAAEASLERGSYRMAERQAERALELDPDDEEAAELIAKAQKDRKQAEDLQRLSERFTPDAPDDLEFAGTGAWRASATPREDLFGESTKEMLELLLVTTTSHGDIDPFSEAAIEDPEGLERAIENLERLSSRARMMIYEDPDGPLADEAEFVLSLAQHDLGFDESSWDRLRALGREAATESNMSRHANAMLHDPWQNTYGNYLRQRNRATDKAAMRRIFGRFADGPPNKLLPAPLAYLISFPSLAQTVVTAPMRLFFGTWNIAEDYKKAAAIAAYRHLVRNPHGTRSREVASWLYDYEIDHENWAGALQLVDLQANVDDTERVILMEKAARRRLDAAEIADRRDYRSAVLRGLARTYPDTDAGFQAGEQLRALVEDASPQRIRMTRSFLQENPEIAGAQGLGVSPALLDEELSNGEVHPDGVTFLGGQVMEFALVSESGDEDDPPYTRRQHISADRLARAVSMLDETVTKNQMLDDGEAVYPDAFRDQYFERARLGLADEPDMRASAQSSYVYESLREQYGLVRGRDSILPFDLVFQGSLGNMTLGAFPRWRQPRETPDAFLYR